MPRMGKIGPYAAGSHRKPIGRPRKFKEAGRRVTVTLPESSLRLLALVNPDRSLAITRVATYAAQMHDKPDPVVEIVEVMKHTGLIMIGPCSALRAIPFLRLGEVEPGRFILALDPGYDSSQLELALRDLLEDMPEEERHEKPLIEKLLTQISGLRRARSLNMTEVVLVDLSTEAT